MRDGSALYSAPGGANGSEPNERLQPFDPTVTTVGSPTVATVGIPTALERVGSDPDSGAGPVRVAVCSQPIPADPIQKEPGRVGNPNPNPARHRPVGRRRQRRRARAHACMCGHSSLLFARENSKYPKGTPFVLNFLYLYTTNFHPTANVGLNAFSYLLSHFGLELGNL